MEITVNLKLSGDPELMMTLGTLVQCISEVLHVSKAQLADEEQANPQPVAADPQPAVAQAVVQAAPSVVQAPAPVVQAPAVPATPVPAAPARNFTWAEIQTACAPLIDGGASQQALLALLPKYNVASLTAIPAERYGELVVDLRALGVKI